MLLTAILRSAFENLKGASPAAPGSEKAEQKTEVGHLVSQKVYSLEAGCGQVDETISKIYSNMSACHIKQGNWKRAIETADKVIDLAMRVE